MYNYYKLFYTLVTTKILYRMKYNTIYFTQQFLTLQKISQDTNTIIKYIIYLLFYYSFFVKKKIYI